MLVSFIARKEMNNCMWGFAPNPTYSFTCQFLIFKLEKSQLSDNQSFPFKGQGFKFHISRGPSKRRRSRSAFPRLKTFSLLRFFLVTKRNEDNVIFDH
jgi:hypothetical protein